VGWTVVVADYWYNGCIEGVGQLGKGKRARSDLATGLTFWQGMDWIKNWPNDLQN